MNVVYAHEQGGAHQSLFLAGPSPRKETDGQNWRLEALEELKRREFGGHVYVPLPRGKNGFDENDKDQIDWELANLELSRVILFWVPRHLTLLPGFTTNVEFGLFAKSGKVVLGYPEGAPKTNYLHHLATRFRMPPVRHTLTDTITEALKLLATRP